MICEFHGALNCRMTTLDVVAVMEYAEDYLDIRELLVVSARRNELVRASDRLALRFQEENWSFLESYCKGEARALAEYYRDLREEAGDFKYHAKREEKSISCQCAA